jgi:hypothetical protein
MSQRSSLVTTRCAQLRELGPRVAKAFRKALLAEGTVDHPVFEAEYLALEQRYDELAREVWSTPAHSWQDIIERAEIAYALADGDPLKSLSGGDMERRAAAELLMAVLAMAGGPTWRPW